MRSFGLREVCCSFHRSGTNRTLCAGLQARGPARPHRRSPHGSARTSFQSLTQLSRSLDISLSTLLRTSVPPEAGPDFVAGYSYLTPVVAMSIYLDWLEQCAKLSSRSSPVLSRKKMRSPGTEPASVPGGTSSRLVEELGGKFHWGIGLARIGDAARAVAGRQASLVVNASGLGAGALCGAERNYPLLAERNHFHTPLPTTQTPLPTRDTIATNPQPAPVAR